METSFLVFDVETADTLHSKICSIGITLIDNWEISKAQNIFVNPECKFSKSNTQIHGLTEQDVASSDIFPVVWENIKPLFFERVVIAHNALFDLSVLRKTLNYYGIDEPEIRFLDTLQMSQDAYPDFPSHALSSICNELGISLTHHDSGSDCEATAKIFLDMCLNKHLTPSDYIQSYPLEKHTNASVSTNFHMQLSAKSRSLLELKKMLPAIIYNGQVEMAGLKRLYNWVCTYSEFSLYTPLRIQIEKILSAEMLDTQEIDELSRICNRLLDPVNSDLSYSPDLSDIVGKNIVLTGDFIKGSKSDVESILVSHGAVIQKNVTKKTNIVLVGNQPNPAWIAGNYGTKIRKAMEYIDKGVHIEIIKECDFWRE